jgi:glutamate-1-semialdehyde aminotransferase
MNNIQELRASILESINALRTGAITPAIGREIYNGAGKACATVKLEIQYAEVAKKLKLDIDFMRPVSKATRSMRPVAKAARKATAKVVPFRRKAA